MPNKSIGLTQIHTVTFNTVFRDQSSTCHFDGKEIILTNNKSSIILDILQLHNPGIIMAAVAHTLPAFTTADVAVAPSTVRSNRKSQPTRPQAERSRVHSENTTTLGNDESDSEIYETVVPELLLQMMLRAPTSEERAELLSDFLQRDGEICRQRTAELNRVNKRRRQLSKDFFGRVHAVHKAALRARWNASKGARFPLLEWIKLTKDEMGTTFNLICQVHNREHDDYFQAYHADWDMMKAKYRSEVYTLYIETYHMLVKRGLNKPSRFISESAVVQRPSWPTNKRYAVKRLFGVWKGSCMG